MNMQKLYILDTMFFIFRAYYSMPVHLSASNGQHTGAVLGVYNAVRNLFGKHRWANCVAVCEFPCPTFRHKLDASYKAQRPQAPDILKEQIPLVLKMLECLGMRTASVEGFEADDVMASIARRVSQAGDEVALITTDKDLAQVLVYPGVSVIHPPQKRADTEECLSAEDVPKKYGVCAANIPAWLALMGDNSDNIKGLPGVGPKGAAKLLSIATLDELLENPQLASRAGKKYPEMLIQYRDLLRHNLQLTSVCYQVEVPQSNCASDFALRPLQADVIRDFFGKLELHSVQRDLDCLDLLEQSTIADVW